MPGLMEYELNELWLRPSVNSQRREEAQKSVRGRTGEEGSPPRAGSWAGKDVTSVVKETLWWIFKVGQRSARQPELGKAGAKAPRWPDLGTDGMLAWKWALGTRPFHKEKKRSSPGQ